MPKTRAHRKTKGGQGFFQSSPPQATLSNVGNSAYQTSQKVGQSLSSAFSGLSNWWNNLRRPASQLNNQYVGGRRRRGRKTRKVRK